MQAHFPSKERVLFLRAMQSPIEEVEWLMQDQVDLPRSGELAARDSGKQTMSLPLHAVKCWVDCRRNEN